MEAIKKVVELPPPDPTAPGIFRLAKPDDLAGILQQAGLVDVTDQEFLAEWSYASAEEYYTSLMEIAAPVQNLMAKISAPQVQEVRSLITQAATQYQRGNRITFPPRRPDGRGAQTSVRLPWRRNTTGSETSFWISSPVCTA
jgi:hypothetical protein